MKKEEKKKYYIFKMNTAVLTLFSVVLLVAMFPITELIYPSFINDFSHIMDTNIVLLFVILFAYLGLHELLHSLAYVIYGGDYKKITYGIALELGVLYCLCKQNITKKNILHSLLYPFFFIGIVTYVIGVIYKLPGLVQLSIFNISGCSGDIIMFIFISRLKNIEFSEMDDPIAFGIYSSEDVSKISHFGLTYEGTKDKLDRNDFEKVKVSKYSKIILIVMILLAILIEIL